MMVVGSARAVPGGARFDNPTTLSVAQMAYKDEVKLSKRKETLPRRFRDIFPGLNTFCNEWNDYNDSFRDCNHDLRSLNDEMQMALDAGHNEKLTKLLAQAEVSCASPCVI